MALFLRYYNRKPDGIDVIYLFLWRDKKLSGL